MGAKKKTDYEQLKMAYITGRVPSLAQFARDNGVKYHTLMKYTSGWKALRRKHWHTVADTVQDCVTQHEVMRADRQAQLMTGLLQAIVQHFQHVHERLEEWEQTVGSPEKPTMNDLVALRTHMKDLTKLMPDVGKHLQLLTGGATSRIGVEGTYGGRNLGDLSEAELYEAEIVEAQKVLGTPVKTEPAATEVPDDEPKAETAGTQEQAHDEDDDFDGLPTI